MADLIAAALTAALMDGVPLVRRDAGAVESGPQSLDLAERQRMARDEAGIEHGARLPKRGTDARRAYDTAMRRFQRYVPGPGERRRTGRANPISATARRAMATANVMRARRNGLLMRLRAAIRVSKVVKIHTMPSDAGGFARMVHIPGSSAGPALDAWSEGDMDGASGLLLAAFFVHYWGNPNPAEVGSIERCEVKIA